MKDIQHKNTLIKYTISGIISVSVSGTIAHFIYEWTGKNKLIGLFSAVNESTWEHMKLFFFAMLAYYLFILIKFRKKKSEMPDAVLLSTLAGTFLIPVLFYSYTGVLGFMITGVNIAIFYISAIIAFTLFYCTCKITIKKWFKTIIYFLIVVLICMFFLFTYDPPKLNIFISPDI